jgi:pyrimidine operon attenuation protein/uracil phosphoribosyltransferase
LAQFEAPSRPSSDAAQTAPLPSLANSSRSADHSTAPSRSASERDQAGSSSGPDEDATVPERTILDDRAIRRALMRIAHEIVERTEDPDRLYLVAIPNGGVPLGRILVENLESLTGIRVPLGILDTTLYRDDLSTRGSRPRLRRTEMPSSVDDRIVVLVEDVVSTGRTIRAGMDALMDFGRPSHVRVVALVDRGHRELPIKIDFVGKNIPTQPHEKVIFRVQAVGETGETGDMGDKGEIADKADAGEAASPEGLGSTVLELIVREGQGS